MCGHGVACAALAEIRRFSRPTCTLNALSTRPALTFSAQLPRTDETSTTLAVDDVENVMRANARGAWLVCQAAGRVLLLQGRGDGLAAPAAGDQCGGGVGAVLKGVSDEMIAVSVPVPPQRFYRRESKLARALLAWVERVDT